MYIPTQDPRLKTVNKRLFDPWSWSLVVILGVATGAGTRLGQRALPDGLLQFANSYAVWLTVAFVAGLFLRSIRGAIIGGALTELIALIAYYVSSRIMSGLSLDSDNDFIAWAIGGLLAGPVLAVAGYFWRNGSDRWRIVSTAVLAAMFVSEGIYLINTLGYEIGNAFVGIGATMAIALAGAWRHLVATFLLAAVLSVAFWIACRYGYTHGPSSNRSTKHPISASAPPLMGQERGWRDRSLEGTVGPHLGKRNRPPP